MRIAPKSTNKRVMYTVRKKGGDREGKGSDLAHEKRRWVFSCAIA